MDKITRKLMKMYKALHPREENIDFKCEKKKEEVDLISLKMVLMHRYNDLKTTYKSPAGDTDIFLLAKFEFNFFFVI